MAANESKQRQGFASDVGHAVSALSLLRKRLFLMKQELVRKVDRWGGQLPNRLLAGILDFSTAREVTRAQTVCGSWKLSSNLADRLWRRLYEVDWEAQTAHDAPIANGGAATSWVVRYKRRHQTEQ